jgi:hypothetical protein
MTQEMMVLNHLIENGTITSLEAIQEYGITRLSDRIYTLRNKGYLITNDWTSGLNRFGKKVRWVKYTLEGKNELEI